MSWRKRAVGYVPTHAEVEFDVSLGLDEEANGVCGANSTAELIMALTRR